METNFENDLEYANRMQQYLKQFYSERSFEGRFVFVNKGNKLKSLGSGIIQRKAHIDTIIQVGMSESILIDEKFRRIKYNDLLIETDSCTNIGREKKGWIYTSLADYLIYAMDSVKLIDVYLINMKKLKDFYNKYGHKFPSNTTKQINRTRFIIVPWKDIEKYVGYKKFTIEKKQETKK